MDNRNFEHNLLKIKKAKFLEIVERTAKSLKVVVPGVVFWDGDCPYYSGKERAHIHPDDLTICISVRELKRMTFEDIEECASHEVTHLTDSHPETKHVHSPDFYRRHNEAKIDNWRPPGGVVVIDGGRTSSDKVLPKTKKFIDKIRCNYHQCREKRELYKCQYCKKYFCEEHKTPYEPYVGPIDKRPHSYNTLNGHPCPDYAEQINKPKDDDYPYECKHCGKIVEFKNRFRWSHDCTPEKSVSPEEEQEEDEDTEVPPEPDLEQFPQLCPICKTYYVIPIIYGLPSQDLSELAKHGKVKLGGCIVSPNNPKYWCTTCKKNIKKPEGKIPKYIKKQSNKDENGFNIKYTYKTRHEAESIFKTAKITQTNIIEKSDLPGNLMDIKLNDNSVIFIYKTKKSKLLLTISISILVILLISVMWFIMDRNHQVNIKTEEIKNISSNTTKIIYEPIPIKLSFSEYINNKERYDGKIITLTGFLRYGLEGTENVGVYNEYIVDDFNNEIRLQNIPQEYRKLFIIKETSKELYNVTGTFKRKFRDIGLEVSNIIKTERTSQMVAREVTVQN